MSRSPLILSKRYAECSESEDSVRLLVDVINHFLGESVPVCNILKHLKKSNTKSLERKLLILLLCSSTSLSVINEVLDYGDRKLKQSSRITVHGTDGHVGASMTLDTVNFLDQSDRPRHERERKRHPCMKYLLRNMCDVVNGILDDELYFLIINLKSCNVSGVMMWTYQWWSEIIGGVFLIHGPLDAVPEIAKSDRDVTKDAVMFILQPSNINIMS